MAQFISNVLATIKTSAAELPPAVRFVPASYLFTHAEPLPDGIQPSELDGFAEVTLEGLSPVPMEQLAWGYMADDKSRHMFIFAALRERLTADNLAPDESFYHILPSFFAAAPDASASAHWVFLWEAGHLAAVHYGVGEVIPSRIEVEVMAEDTPAGAFAAREHLLKRLAGNARHEAATAVLARPEGVRASRDRLSFWFASYASSEAEAVRIAGHPPASLATRWSSDLRGGQFRSTEQKRRSAARLSTTALKIAALFIIGLIGAQGYWAYLTISVKKTDSLLTDKARTNVVDNIKTENDLLNTIQKFTAHQLHPFEMIGVINMIRPPSVTYKNLKVTEAYDEHTKKTVAKVIAACVADNGANSMNDFAHFLDSLKNSTSLVVDADPRPQQVYGGKVNFSISLTFPDDKIPDYEFPVPPPPPVAPPPAEPDVLDEQDAAVGPEPVAPASEPILIAQPPEAAVTSNAPRVIGAAPAPPPTDAPAPAATTEAAPTPPAPPPAPGT